MLIDRRQLELGRVKVFLLLWGIGTADETGRAFKGCVWEARAVSVISLGLPHTLLLTVNKHQEKGMANKRYPPRGNAQLVTGGKIASRGGHNDRIHTAPRRA